MTGDRARSRLAGTRFGDVRWVDETGSTNADLLQLAADGEPEGVVLVADHQTGGRGRLGRTWTAPPRSSLLVSILLRPSLPAGLAFAATMAVGVSAAEACREVAGVEVGLKWPNDLVVEVGAGEQRKLGGMLAESLLDGDRVGALVVGLGLNVNWPAALPAELDGIAVALNHRTGSDVDREDLLVALLTGLDQRRDRLADEAGRAELRREYLDRCTTIGRRVRAELADRSLEGTAADLSPEGHLVVEDARGHRHEVVAGDLVHLR